MVVVESGYLALNYWDEFQELWNGTFGAGRQVKYPKVMLSGKKVENYFCPEDHCAYHIEEEIKKAKKNIYFLSF